MTAFTDNTVALRPGDGSFGQTSLQTMDSNSSDVSTSTELLAAVTGARHYIKHITITMFPGTTAVWFKVFSASTIKIGPVDMIDYHGVWERTYPGLGLEMGSAEAINVQTEAADQIHISMDYRTRYNQKPLN